MSSFNLFSVWFHTCTCNQVHAQVYLWVHVYFGSLLISHTMHEPIYNNACIFRGIPHCWLTLVTLYTCKVLYQMCIGLVYLIITYIMCHIFGFKTIQVSSCVVVFSHLPLWWFVDAHCVIWQPKWNNKFSILVHRKCRILNL